MGLILIDEVIPSTDLGKMLLYFVDPIFSDV